MNLYKIRVTAEVLETAASTRRVEVDGLVLTFGSEPVYISGDELPEQLATDPYLRIEAVDSAPSGTPVIDLKSERVQEPTTAVASADVVDFPGGGDDADLKSERVQKPAAAVAPATPAAPSRKRA